MGFYIGESSIEGKGLFSDTDISSKFLVGLTHEGGAVASDIGQFHNHSDNPNAESILIGDKRYLITKRPIKRGEELTVDYRKQPELEQPEDFNMSDKLPKLQYGILFPPLRNLDPISTQSTNIFGQRRLNNLNNIGNQVDIFGLSNLFNMTGTSDDYHTGDPRVDYRTTNLEEEGVIYLTEDELNAAQDGYSDPSYVPPSKKQLRKNNIDFYNEHGYEFGTEDELREQGIDPFKLKKGKDMYKFDKTDFSDFIQDPAMLADIDLNSALFMAGQSFGFNSDIVQNPEAKRQARRGNTMRGIGAVGKSLLNMGRLVGAGLGYQNRLQHFYEDLGNKKRKALVGTYRFEDGGLLQFLRNGGTIDQLTPEQVLTGEYITGLPKHAEDKANAEIEVDEYVKHPNGDVQKVVGKTHKQGGEKVNLEVGTKVVSDNLKLGGDNAKEVRKEYDIKVKAGTTYAEAIDKYTVKIGLKKLNEEQEKLFKKLKSEEDTEDETTSDLNRQFLSEKIKEIEDKKKSLIKQREDFVDFIFTKQEKAKENLKEEDLQVLEDGGLIKDARFKELCKRYNIDEKQGIELYNNFKNGGINFDLPKYQNGKDVEPLYGIEALQRILAAYSNDPSYSYKDLEGELGRIQQFASEYGVDISDRLGENPSQQDLDSLAGFLQEKVIENNPELARHYGTNVAPTANGLNYLLGKGLPKEYLKGLLTSDGKVRSGTKEGTLAEEDISKISDWARENLDGESLKQFAKTNFNDNKWYYRYPELKRIYYKDKDKFNEIVGSERNLGNFNLSTEKVGLYENPYLLQPKEFETQEEYDAWVEKNKDREDKTHKGYYGVEEDNHIFYKPTVKEKVEEKVQEEVKQTPTEGLDISKIRKRLKLPYLPDQSVVPPNGLIPHVKIEREYERLDPFEITNEENLKEIYRSQDFANEQLSELPDSQRRAALANLIANSQEAVNKSVTQTEIANAQNFQQTEQFNINQGVREEDNRAIDTLDFERRQLTALAKTQADLDNYFDFNRRIRLGNFNTANKFNLLNDLYENFDVNPFGSVEHDPTKMVNFLVSSGGLTKQQGKKVVEDLKKKKKTKG